jgi:hypothetical protein
MMYLRASQYLQHPALSGKLISPYGAPVLPLLKMDEPGCQRYYPSVNEVLPMLPPLPAGAALPPPRRQEPAHHQPAALHLGTS